MTRLNSWLPWVCLALLLSCKSESDESRGAAPGPDEPNNAGSGGTTGGEIPNGVTGDASTPFMMMEPPMPSGIEGSIDPDCIDDCKQTIIGEGSDPFDPSSPGSSSVGVDPDGALVITPGESVTSGPSFIWIANTEGRACSGNTVSKVDTDAMVEVARYEIGFCDPSRTSVNIAGDVFVASRSGHGVTKILAGGQNCPDTNGDGVITTSTGPGDVLPLGQDDCVPWWTALPAGDIRGIAAQDVGGEVTVEPQLDDAPPIVTVEPTKSYVWASGVEHNVLYKLDGDTGDILFETTAPAGAYGAALDGNGLLWMTGGALGGGNLGFVDTNQCVDAQSCSAAPCMTTCDAGGCAGNCDGAVKGHITLPGAKYGITVDCKQRVWLAGFTITNVQRYDHYAPPGQRFAEAAAPDGHGITADGLGRVWVGRQFANIVTRIDGDTLAVADISVPSPKGMAVDSAGKVWVVRSDPDGGNAAHVITPGVDINDNTVQVDAVTGFLAAYTYSDMTGQQLRLASREPSVYVQTIEACGGAGTDWRNLTWDVEVPPGGYIVFRGRVGTDEAELEQAEWLTLATLPGDGDQVALGPFIDPAMQSGHMIQLEVSMASPDGNTSNDNGCGLTGGTTPRVKSFGVSYDCNVVVE